MYPLGAAGAQVLGYVGEAGPDDKDADGNPYTTATLIGRAGIERKYNQYLEGKNGSKTIEVNASGQPVGYVGGTPAVSGNNIRLTLDANLQKAAEDAIDSQVKILAKSGIYATGASAVAIDPNSGAVLAMVSEPSYDPNRFSKGISTADWNQIINNKIILCRTVPLHPCILPDPCSRSLRGRLRWKQKSCRRQRGFLTAASTGL